jgi:hypothetical protein
MFPQPSRWLNDPFRHFANPPTPIPLQTYTSASTLGPYFNDFPHRPRRHIHKGKHNHSTPFSDASETDLDDTTDTDTPYTRRGRNIDFEHFPRTQLRLPRHTSNILRSDTILILPPTLTNLKITLHTHTLQRNNTIRAAVAGDMRLRDVVKQILPHNYLCDVRVYVRSRGEWVEPGSPVKVSDIVELGRVTRNERGEVEIKIVAGERERDDRRGHGWEREVGRVDRMRVY